jgi:formylglycine-generating enzyme required for sulfatase activity
MNRPSATLSVISASLVLWAASARTGPIEESANTVFGIQRAPDADLLALLDGSTLAGALTNKTFALKTPYAPILFEQAMLAGIDLRDASRTVAIVQTANGSRFSGFLEDLNFFLQPQSGETVQVRREKVGYVVFRTRNGEPAGIRPSRWIHLRNGDCFSGEFAVDSLPLSSPAGRESFGVKSVQSLSFTTNHPPLASLTLQSGRSVQGRVALEDIPIRLDLGSTVLIYRDHIRSIDNTPPPAASPAAAAKPGETTPLSPAASSGESRPPIAGMVWIPAGEFIMGSPPDEPGRDADEGPQTRVVVPHGLYMGKCEVTQAEYQAVMGVNPSNARGNTNCPVEKVSWYDAMQYCARRTQQEQAAGRLPEGFLYRLPTEAEWEYACRAGTATRFFYGDDKGEFRLEECAWFVRNSDSTTHPAGTLKPNPWGLHDMHGNVWEWCCDRLPGVFPGGSVTNMPSTASGSLRVARGGSWLYEGKACRSANRDDYGPSNRCSDVGFRIVLAPL